MFRRTPVFVTTAQGQRVRRGARLLAAVFSVFAGGCALSPTAAGPCAAGESLQQRDTLYFGMRRMDGSEVTAAQWDRFRDDVLGAAFPAGMTVLDAHGHWRAADGTSIREASRVVVLVHAPDAAIEQRIGDSIANYRDRFQQESVLREHAPVCVRF